MRNVAKFRNPLTGELDRRYLGANFGGLEATIPETNRAVLAAFSNL